MTESIQYIVCGGLSVILGIALFGIASFGIVTTHPQRLIVLPVYLGLTIFDLLVGYTFLTHSGVGNPPLIPWLLLTSFSISALYKTARPILKGVDFRDAGIFSK